MADSPATISAIVVHAVLDALAGLGVDLGERAPDRTARVSASTLQRLWTRAEAASGDRHIGLTVATRFAPGAFGAFDYMVRNTPTLRATIDRSERFLRLIDDHGRIALDEDRGRATFRFWSAMGVPWTHHDMECLFAVLVQVIRRAVPDAAPPQVRFAHAAVPPLERYLASFSAMPVFDAEHYEIVLPSSLLDRPIGAVDAGLGAVLEAHVAQLVDALPAAGAGAQIRSVVRELLPEVSLEEVARRLGVSERTLRRRLEEEGTSFRDLVGDVRRDLASHYVGETKRPLKEVATLLGFTDQSTFQRAFKRWHDTTPAQYRRARTR